MSLGNEYLRIILGRFQNVKSLGDKAIDQLSEEELHWTLNEESNSISIIIKHVRGNMVSRWTNFLTTDGEKPNRNREQEFVDSKQSKEELIESWNYGWNVVLEALQQLTEEDLLKQVYIRGEKYFVLDAIEWQLAHYAYHVGQIVYIGKQVKNEEWECISIPKGKSAQYLQEMIKKHSDSSQ
ncbi:DinB family protein [Bacillus massiliigorillae]|uniref:DinB family protein n=1 Tax=Bacillus massiliigorillae TaxID=1243664 RepID=UPI00039AD7BD|nr:DinB family protein [Bacillus massiliigorillae]